jgi:lipoyl(octanoyl) transferase
MTEFKNPADKLSSVIWRYTRSFVDYLEALTAMEATVCNIHQGKEPETIWCLEHPPVFTAGTSSKNEHLLNNLGFPVYHTGRGGQFTYHGPGQLVVYVMLDINKRGRDIKNYINALELWVIDCLSHFNIQAEQRKGRVGLWIISKNNVEEKIAAIGVRITRWISWHGLSINVAPDLTHFNGIVPCGIAEYGVTSLEKLGIKTTTEEVQSIMHRTCPFLV